MPPAAPDSTVSSSTAAKNEKVDIRPLQERLHELLSRLADTTDVVKNWKEDGDHAATTNNLIKCVQETVRAIERVEGVVKTDETLWTALKNCPIPLDLLELLDYGNGLNPDCFSRELLREALGQLAGLKRRKLALEMLGSAIEAGLDKTESTEPSKEKENNASLKREREPVPANESDQSAAKKQHTGENLLP